MLRKTLVIFSLSLPIWALSQIDRKAKIQMIRDIETFGAKELSLSLKPGFYETWEQPDTMTCYLYISRKDSIKAPLGVGSYIFFGTRYTHADSARNHWDSMGYATLLYYTSGNSATKLSSRFLSYPPHAIAFVCFHELFHRHKSNKKSRLPYAFEEATCDWLGNTAAAAFFEKYAVSHPMFKGYADSVRFQTNINLQTFQLLTRASVPSANRKAIADSLELLKPYYNLFQQDRLLYPLNNALLLRTSYYARNLFLINDVFATIGSISKTIRYMTRLHGTEAQVRKRILKKIRS